MKTLRYLNSVLTVIAVLLTLNLYVQLTAPVGPTAVSFATPAHAAAKDKRGVGSQAARQGEMINAIKQLAKTTETIKATLSGAPLRVQVENFPAQD